MKGLEETVLRVSSGETVMNVGSVVVDWLALSVDSLSVTFHFELLDVGDKLGKRLRIRYNGSGGLVSDGDLVPVEGTEKKWNVL